MSETPAPTKSAAAPPGEPGAFAWAALLLSWLVPGLGFILTGRPWRGFAQLILVSATFYLGIALHAGVDWPTWNFRSEDFNLIDNIGLIAQLGAGLPAALSLAASTKGIAPLHWMAAARENPYFELGSYFLIVAGALNYFAVGNFYDRMIRLHPRFAEQELGPEDDSAS